MHESLSDSLNKKVFTCNKVCYTVQINLAVSHPKKVLHNSSINNTTVQSNDYKENVRRNSWNVRHKNTEFSCHRGKGTQEKRVTGYG